MKTFNASFKYETYAHYQIEAQDKDEAQKLARERLEKNPDEYLHYGSWTDTDIHEEGTDIVECPHCKEQTHIGGLIGEHTNDCPKCGKKALITKDEPCAKGSDVTKYNHMFTIAFSFVSPNDGENVTADELREGLRKRLLDLAGADEIIEACGLPHDTYIEMSSL
jgi:hypothetical protein